MRAAVRNQRGGDVESSSPKSGCAMRFQQSQPAGAATLVPPFASTGPLKNMDASSPARKAHACEMHEKAGSISSLGSKVGGHDAHKTRTRRLHARLAYVMRVDYRASVAHAATFCRPRPHCEKKTFMRSGCASHAWLTLSTIRWARRLS
jgi:hypothetical protein